MTVREILDEGMRTAGSGDLASAATLFEEALKRDPDNRKALWMLGAVTQDRAGELERPKSTPLYLRSAEALRRLRAKYPNLEPGESRLFALALFNEARTLAAEGRTQKALDSLAEAVDAGFLALGPLRSEPELEPLRGQPRFREILARVEAQATAQAKQRVQALLGGTRPYALDFKLPSVDGKTVASADFAGKVVVVDIWGTWCPPCRKEVPVLAGLYRKYHDQGLEIVGINYERVADDEVKPTIEAFVKENAVPYPCLIGDDETRGKVVDFEAFPTTLFLDRQGRVRAKQTGFDPEAEMVMEQLIATLLAEGPATPAPGR